MKKRFEEILSFVKESECFADVGCDHGKIALSVLKSGKCKTVIASDISAESLKKVVKTADNEGIKGLIAIVSDGFESIPYAVDQAVIAGMGGEEICKILSAAKALPERLVLQPMKNAERVRRLVFSELGYASVADRTFYDGEKFYDVIVCDRGAAVREYGERDYRFGIDNLKGGADFVRYCSDLIATYEAALKSVGSERAKNELTEKIEELKEIVENL